MKGPVQRRELVSGPSLLIILPYREENIARNDVFISDGCNSRTDDLIYATSCATLFCFSVVVNRSDISEVISSPWTDGLEDDDGGRAASWGLVGGVGLGRCLPGSQKRPGRRYSIKMYIEMTSRDSAIFWITAGTSLGARGS